MAKTGKYYAVKSGRKPGIYTTWEECAAQVTGYAGAAYKAFARLQDAQAYLKAGESESYVQPALLPLEPEPEPRPKSADLKPVTMYTDGGAQGNPGPGGFGVVLASGGARKELSGGYAHTTNNRMELLAVITGLEALKEPAAVTIFSDSSYIVNAMRNGIARRWQQQNWKRRDGPVPNADLWERLLALAAKHDLTFEWVPGHSGIPENERCDQLAVAAAARPDLPPDPGYPGKE